MKTQKFTFLIFIMLTSCFATSQFVYADDVPLKRDANIGNDAVNNTSHRTRIYIPLTASFESGELGLFFESTVGMCNVSIEDENGNVQMSETIDTDNGTEFWFDLSGLSSGLHYVKISYGSMSLVGEFYVE